MLKINCLTILLLFTSPAICQQTVEGIVVDSSTNLPIEGATVTLLPSQIFTITNASGRFSFRRNTSNATAIVVSDICYAKTGTYKVCRHSFL